MTVSVKIMTCSFLKHKLIQLGNTSMFFFFCTVQYSQDQAFTQYKQNLGGEFCFTLRLKVSILGTLEKSLCTIRFSIIFAWNSIFPFGRGSIFKCCSFQTISLRHRLVPSSRRLLEKSCNLSKQKNLKRNINIKKLDLRSKLILVFVIH